MKGKYNHKIVENGKNAKWIKNKYFSTHNESKIPFTIILPPPNVTGKLHLGHAWGSYIQDTLIRYKKISGYDVMWIPGIDHAGIATQAKVESKIRKNHNLTKEDLGREKFLQEIWNWKEKYAARIKDQWNQLGLAFDYENERFTMDAGLSKAVLKVFINLYNRKLIYRSKRAINYDVKLKTVLSNIEVENREVKQKLYYIKYQLENGEPVTIATVRPETLFSDVALAVNSNDKRYKHLVGKHIIHPLLKTRQPIITNDHIEMTKGTGIMKVSAHSVVDAQIIMENNLEINECIDNDGFLNARAMEFKGLERIVAREKIIAKLRREGMIEKVENKISVVGFSQRSDSVVEILVKPQWFIKMDLMAKYIFDDYKKEGVKFFPSRFCDHLKHWMENVYDWCISRQLWWGHRIPAWYKNNEIKVQINSPGNGWKQDEDVLDTWFSSGLAPFSFLGWPNQTKKLNRYYPTNLLVTGYDIIFFWVARMYFQGLDIMKEKPFKEVLVHGIFRDHKGQKMSKSLGNGVDPSELIEKYGSDTLRWMLLINSTPGLDINYSQQKIQSAWSFSNKLWNIARYILFAMDQTPSEISDADVWINNKLLDLKNAIDKNIANYEFTIIGKKIQKFIIEDLSSWYIEITKTTPNQVFAKAILEKLLIILHPFLPFLTDHIFKLINGQELLESDNPKLALMKPSKDINKLITVTKILRRFRDERSISKKIKLLYWTDIKFSPLEIELINKLAKASLEKNNDVILPYGQHKIFVKQSNQELAEAEKFVQNQIKKLEFEIKRAQQILSNENFIKNAPEWKVVEEKTKLQKYENELKQLVRTKIN